MCIPKDKYGIPGVSMCAIDPPEKIDNSKMSPAAYKKLREFIDAEESYPYTKQSKN